MLIVQCKFQSKQESVFPRPLLTVTKFLSSFFFFAKQLQLIPIIVFSELKHDDRHKSHTALLSREPFFLIAPIVPNKCSVVVVSFLLLLLCHVLLLEWDEVDAKLPEENPIDDDEWFTHCLSLLPWLVGPLMQLRSALLVCCWVKALEHVFSLLKKKKQWATTKPILGWSVCFCCWCQHLVRLCPASHLHGVWTRSSTRNKSSTSGMSILFSLFPLFPSSFFPSFLLSFLFSSQPKPRNRCRCCCASFRWYWWWWWRKVVPMKCIGNPIDDTKIRLT